MLRRFSFLLALLLASAGTARAQDLGETLNSVGEAYARGYVAPFVDALGADLNAGLFHTARVGRGPYGISFYLGVEAFGTLLSEADQRFDLTFQDEYEIGGDLAEEILGFRPDDASLPLRVPAQLTVRGAPTVFGGETDGNITIAIDAETSVRYLGVTRSVSLDTTLTEPAIDGLVPTTFAPLAAPQVGIGFLGTDVLIRWLPRIGYDDLGAVELLGLGVRHNLSQYAPHFPVDVAVQVAWQQLELDDAEDQRVVTASTFAANLQLSKQLSVLTLYGGAQIEQSNVTVSYTLEPDGLEGEAVAIDFDAVGLNRARGIVGFGLHLGPVLLHGDVGFGRLVVVSAGLGIAL